MNFRDSIDAFRPAEGPPPQKLGAFFMWCLSGAWGPLALATALSAIAGAMEVVTAWFLGLIVDLANDRDPGSGILDQWPMLLAFVLFLVILRPISFGLSAASNSVIVQPNVLPLVLSR
ncbi:MAG: ABC transporter ATP-binding protein, partial [Paracoccaceae bacterium]|nr:ABC transporter ATP-binding protein [Paracoccaceae bacterium]